MASQSRVDPLGCEVRAVTEGLRAFHNGDGTFSVRSSSRPGIRWNVTVAMWLSEAGWRLTFGCDCEAGRSRPAEAVACLHSACVGRSLERRGLAKWVGGLWSPTEKVRAA